MSQEVIPAAGFWARGGPSIWSMLRSYASKKIKIKKKEVTLHSYLQNRLRQYKGRGREVRNLLLWPEGGDLDQDSWEELSKNSYTYKHSINAYLTEFAKGEN